MRLTVRDRGAAIIAMVLGGPARGERMGGLGRLALGGFDPVSYLLPGGPEPGSVRFELSWGGWVRRFTSEGDRAAIRADPDVYARRFGSYDAAGLLDGHNVDADPGVFAVIGGRLYLFRDAERRARMRTDTSLARAAEALRPGLRRLTDGLPA